MSHVVNRLLLGHGVKPVMYEVEESEAGVVEEMLGRSGDERLQFPCVFIGGAFVGGLDRLMAVHIFGELPFVCCASNNQLRLTTHTGSYPITFISYATSTFTITPPLMSTCSSMHSSPNFGIDWTTPFQLEPSTFLLLSCPAPSSSLTRNGFPLCDSSYSHLCAAIYTCPAIVSLGLPLFAPTNSCCVYSPANLGKTVVPA